MNDPRGSIWRRWDLHVHSQSSFDYKNKAISNEEVIWVLKNNQISVAAITDHHKIDIERITDLQRIGEEEGVVILPGIELRTDKGGAENIHIIGIFSQDSRIGSIWEKIKGQLALTGEDIEKKGNERIFCNLEKACDLIHQLEGIVSIHAGKKSNSLEEITNALSHKMALKHEILQYIDIFEMGREADIKEYEKQVFPHISKHPPMVLCSDNHEANSYKAPAPLWIKADQTFEGLKQIIREPKSGDRVQVGAPPKIFGRINNNGSSPNRVGDFWQLDSR